MSKISFSTLKLHASLLKNLASLGYEAMTPVQAQSLPLILQGSDVVVQAKTGSGKTAAFSLGLLNKLDVNRFQVQSLVLCPTRELADQVAKEIRRLARSIHNVKVLTLCGGMPFGPQIGSLEHGAHIVVGTPGRIEEHLRKGKLCLKSLTTLVLDEADRMLDMGFQPALDAIIAYTPSQRQSLLFSATYPDEIGSIVQRVMDSPEHLQVAGTHSKQSIRQLFFQLDQATPRMTALRLLLLSYRPGSSIVFCNTKKETQDVADELAEFGFSALALHGDLEQKARDQALVRFANKSISILAATDVAARGLDIDDLDAVFNYHLSRDTDVHIHRIGRTGRAGNQGIAYSLYNEREAHKLKAIEEKLQQPIEPSPLPDMDVLLQPSYKPPMKTLCIDGGKKQKLRPGDILGALTTKGGIASKDVGKIHIFDHCAYVAIVNRAARAALHKIRHDKLKGRMFRARMF